MRRAWCAPRMKAHLALAAILSALLLVPAPAAGAAEDAAAASLCYNYLFVHDYQWYFLCVNPKDVSCPVYTVKSNDPRTPSGEPDCLVGVPAADESSVIPSARCYKWAQDLERSYYVCYDLADKACMVYLLTTGGWQSQKTCLVSIPTADFATGCILFAQDLDYSYYLCYAPGSLSCPVYTERHGGYGDPTRSCVGLRA